MCYIVLGLILGTTNAALATQFESHATQEATGAAIVRRLVWSYDFDDPESPQDFPLRYWIRMTGDATDSATEFPTWNTTGYLPGRPKKGIKIPRILQLNTKGGSIGIRLVDGVVSALPGADYLLSVKLRTSDINHAKARCAIRFLDNNGQLVPGSEVVSSPINTDGEWEQVQLTLVGEFKTAAWIQIDLVLEQPTRWDTVAKAIQEPAFQDVTGLVQLDDLTIWRLPRAEITAGEHNIIRSPDPVVIRINVQDMTRSPLVGHLRIYDAFGTPVDSYEMPIDQLRPEQHWLPTVSQFGWFRIVMDLYENDDLISTVGSNFVYLPPMEQLAQSVTETRLSNLCAVDSAQPFVVSPEILSKFAGELGVDRLTIPVWSSGLTLSTMRSHRNAIGEVMEHVLAAGPRVSFSITELPIQLAQQLSYRPYRVVDALATDNNYTPSYLEEFLIRFGRYNLHWQIGAHDSKRLIGSTTLSSDASDILSDFASLSPAPIIELPYPAVYEPKILQQSSAIDSVSTESDSEIVPIRYLLNIPPEISPDAIPDYVSAWIKDDIPFQVFCTPIDPDQFGADASISDLIKRVVLAFEAGVQDISIKVPWDYAGVYRLRAIPTVLYPVWHTLTTHVKNREPAGRIQLGHGITAIILRNGDTGCIVCWNDSPTTNPVAVSSFLGSQPISMIDPMGNQTIIPLTEGEHRFTIGRTPVILEDININIVLFKSRLQFEPEFVEAAAKLHEHSIVVYNPWQTAITGTIRMRKPEHWRFDPRVHRFSIPPQGKQSIPVTFTFPGFELAGDKLIESDVSLQADKEYQFAMTAPLILGYDQITLRPTYRIVPNKNGGSDDIIVEHEITNNSDHPVWVRCFTITPPEAAYPRRHADVTNLLPGETAIRVFRYPGGSAKLKGTSLRVGLRELEGPGRLNLRLDID